MLIHSTSSFNEKRALQRELIDGHKANAFRTQNIIIEVKNWPINCVREQSLVAKQRNLFIICWIRLDKAVLTTISQKVRRTIYKVRRKVTLDRFLVLKLLMNFYFSSYQKSYYKNRSVKRTLKIALHKSNKPVENGASLKISS